MLQGLKDAPGGERALPFVLQFHGRPSTYLWGDCAVVHEISQGEGGEQNDPLMPAWVDTGPSLLCKQLCSLVRNFSRSWWQTLVASRNLHKSWKTLCGITLRINMGETQLFNRGGFLPPGCQHILKAGREMTLPVIVWRGDHMLPDQQQRIVGTPLGT